MDPRHSPIEAQARHQIDERVARAADRRVRALRRRHRLADRLRRGTDSPEN